MSSITWILGLSGKTVWTEVELDKSIVDALLVVSKSVIVAKAVGEGGVVPAAALGGGSDVSVPTFVVIVKGAA